MNKYDLEERTLKFSIMLIETLKKIPRTIYNSKAITQCTSSGTSVGANYREANGAESQKDFIHKIRIAYKEARETVYWLKILIRIHSNDKDFGLSLSLNEADQLVRIFATSIKTCSKK